VHAALAPKLLFARFRPVHARHQFESARQHMLECVGEDWEMSFEENGVVQVLASRHLVCLWIQEAPVLALDDLPVQP
jgi:hypothetical protein